MSYLRIRGLEDLFGEENRGLFNKKLISFEVITDNLWRTFSVYLGHSNLLNEGGSDSCNGDSLLPGRSFFVG